MDIKNTLNNALWCQKREEKRKKMDEERVRPGRAVCYISFFVMILSGCDRLESNCQESTWVSVGVEKNAVALVIHKVVHK